MEEIRYKVARIHQNRNDVEFRSVIIPPSSVMSIVYENGKVAQIPEICVRLGYYPTVFSDLQSLFQFNNFTERKFVLDVVLECAVAEQIIPLPIRLNYGSIMKADKQVPSEYPWPDGTEMWKIVKPIRVIPLEELEAMLNIL